MRVLTLYGAPRGVESDQEDGRSKQRPYGSHSLWRPAAAVRSRARATDPIIGCVRARAKMHLTWGALSLYNRQCESRRLEVQR